MSPIRLRFLVPQAVTYSQVGSTCCYKTRREVEGILQQSEGRRITASLELWVSLGTATLKLTSSQPDLSQASSSSRLLATTQQRTRTRVGRRWDRGDGDGDGDNEREREACGHVVRHRWC